VAHYKLVVSLQMDHTQLHIHRNGSDTCFRFRQTDMPFSFRYFWNVIYVNEYRRFGRLLYVG